MYVIQNNYIIIQNSKISVHQSFSHKVKHEWSNFLITHTELFLTVGKFVSKHEILERTVQSFSLRSHSKDFNTHFTENTKIQHYQRYTSTQITWVHFETKQWGSIVKDYRSHEMTGFHTCKTMPNSHKHTPTPIHVFI